MDLLLSYHAVFAANTYYFNEYALDEYVLLWRIRSSRVFSTRDSYRFVHVFQLEKVISYGQVHA